LLHPYFKPRIFRLLFLWAVLIPCSPAHAQIGSTFGQNKVQYRDFDWSILSTEHFNVYFYEEERPLAERGARMAERSYALLSEALSHEIEEKIPLILYTSHNDFQQTNTVGGIIPEGVQGVTESLKHRVILPFTGSYEQFNHVLTHELVHAFQFDVSAGSERRANPLQQAIPLWFMEGMAEYLSVGMDKGTEIWMADAVKNDELVSVSELNLIADIRVYRFGQALWYYIAKTYGESRVGTLLEKATYLGSTEKALSEVLGLSTDELSEGWQQWVREHFQPMAGPPKPEEHARRVTRHEGFLYNLNVIPALSPRGDRLAYLSNRGLYNDIFLMNLDKEEEQHTLVHGGRSGSFESLRFLDTQLSWSADGRYLALVGESEGKDAILIIDAEKRKEVRRLSPRLDGIISPSFSPDGSRVIFTGIHNGQSDLYTLDLDGKGLVQLTDDVHSDLQPQWSPDGRSIAFSSDRGADTEIDSLLFGKLEISLYDLETGEIRVVTRGREDCFDPAWSPDGAEIGFVSSIEGVPNIYTIDPDSGRLARLTNFSSGIGGITPTSPAFSWAREGRSIAFSSFSNGGWDIFVLENPESDSAGEIVEEEDRFTRTDYTAFPIPELSEIQEEDYQTDFAPDLLVGGVGYANNVGAAGQSYILISDMLGNQNFLIAADIYGSFNESNLLFSYINLAHRTNYALTAFQFRNDFGLFTAPDSAEFVSQIYRGGGIILSRPFDMFSRLEYGANAIFLEEEVFTQSFETQEFVGSSSVNFFVNPVVALVHDNSVFGATGPIAGRRFRIQAEGGVGQIRFTTLTGDFRLYLNFSRRYTLGLWLVGAGSFGENAQIFRVGGPYTFRGADYGDLIGTRVTLQSTEFRFPIFFMAHPKYDFLKGALFWDMAAAWEEGFQPFTTEGDGPFRMNDLRGAYGAGLRLGLGYFVLRLDLAQRTDLADNIGSARGFFSIGGDF